MSPILLAATETLLIFIQLIVGQLGGRSEYKYSVIIDGGPLEKNYITLKNMMICMFFNQSKPKNT